MTGKRLLSIIVGILVVGGLVMFFSLNGDNQLSKEEQQYQLEVQIAKMLVNDYEDVETIEFHGWGHSRETGMWGTTVIVNHSNELGFSFSSLSGLDEISGIVFSPSDNELIEKLSKKNMPKLKDRISDIHKVSLDDLVIHYSKDTRED
ncbi:hypothetical protein ACHBHM_08935 [Streptococcus sp. A18]|uniref:hypothetical protein n=1 Tax=Streptococcus sp. A18 TaxID=3373125 RepID=UPI00374D0CE6